MFKKILLSLASAFLMWQSFGLLSHIHEMEVQSWLLAFLIAFIINLYLTGIFAFLGFAFPTQKLLPQAYYTIHKPNTLKTIYEVLKVNLFRQFLLATFWKGKNQRATYFNGTRRGLLNLVEQSMKSEFGHLIPFLIITVIGVYFLIIKLVFLGLFTIFINLIGNMYPIILQRHHRMRIYNLKFKFLE